MLQKIKNAFFWLLEKAKAAVAWVRENRLWLMQQARQIACQLHKTLLAVSRQVWTKFDQGRAVAILTVQHRQEGASFGRALEQPKAAVRCMSEAEIACLVSDFFTEAQAEAQPVNPAS